MSKKIKNYKKIIDQIEKIRGKNNVSWMNVLRIAFKHSPSETAKVVSKILRYGMQPKDQKALIEEIGDMQCMIDLIVEHKLITKTQIKNRIKVNMYPRADLLFEHGYHRDRPYENRGALFALNTCDGYTKFKDGPKIESIENRMILFDASRLHTSTNTTNVNRRVNINFNYF